VCVGVLQRVCYNVCVTACVCVCGLTGHSRVLWGVVCDTQQHKQPLLFVIGGIVRLPAPCQWRGGC
jgi:hypothetical protein